MLKRSARLLEILEYRQYNISPAGLPQFMELCKKYMPVRCEASPLVGYWRSEIGGLNELHHIWRYESYAHRAEVRAALAAHEEWNQGFIKPAFPHVVSQTNAGVYLPSWAPSFADVQGTGNIYEIWTYNMVPGGPSAWGGELQQLVEALMDYWSLYAVLYTDVGNVDQVRVIWRHNSMDERRAGRQAMKNDALVVKRSGCKWLSVLLFVSPAR